MNMNELIELIKKILLHPFIIGTAIVVILYMNFCCFVANYTKKPKKSKKKTESTPSPKKDSSDENEESSEAEE